MDIHLLLLTKYWDQRCVYSAQHNILKLWYFHLFMFCNWKIISHLLFCVFQETCIDILFTIKKLYFWVGVYGSISRVLAQHTRSPGVWTLVPHKTGAWQHTPVTPTLEKHWQEDQKFPIILSCALSLRAAYDFLWDLLSFAHRLRNLIWTFGFWANFLLNQCPE